MESYGIQTDIEVQSMENIRDFDKIQKRLELVLHGELLDRCCVSVTAPKDPRNPYVDQPEATESWYMDGERILERNLERLNKTYFAGDALPMVFPYFGTGGHAKYFNDDIDVVYMPDTIWIHPYLESCGDLKPADLDKSRFFKREMEIMKYLAAESNGRYFLGMPDNCGSYDALAQLRGNEELLIDFLDEPDEVKYAARLCVDCLHESCDRMFDVVRDNCLGGSIPELVAACEKLEAAGIRSFTNGYAEGWIIAQHFFNGAFLAEVGGTIAKDLGVTDSLANHAEEVAEMVALLQLTAKYGGGEASLATDYNTTLSEFANGEAAMLQQGTWIQPTIDALNPDLKVGMFGFVMNGDEDANVIPVGNAGYWVIPEQSACPEVMKDFLTWMATDEAAINSIINDFAFIPAFTGVDYDLSTIGSIYAALQPYIQQGKTSEWLWDTLPNGFANFLCPAFQQVAIEMISVEDFIAECDMLIADAR